MTTSTVTPIRSKSQCLEALAIANEERSHKAKIKQQLRAEELSPFDVLRDPPISMRVAEFLLCFRQIGETKVRQFCNRARISPHKKLIGLSERQLNELKDFAYDREVDKLIRGRRAA